MIENWKSAWKMASNWVFAAIGILGGLEQFLPALEKMIPPGTYAALMIVGIVARLWKQKNLPDSEELRRLKTLAKSAGLISLLLVCVGCVEPRHPERDECYLAADQAAAQAYITECFDYPDTRVCPHGDAIEEQHGKDLEACK